MLSRIRSFQNPILTICFIDFIVYNGLSIVNVVTDYFPLSTRLILILVVFQCCLTGVTAANQDLILHDRMFGWSFGFKAENWIHFRKHYAKQLQNNLRGSFIFAVLFLPLIICLSLLDHEKINDYGLALLAGVGSELIATIMFCLYFGINPRKWWFFWRGPICIVTPTRNFETNREWLMTTYTDRDFRILNQFTIKFRKHSTAVAFRLMSD